MPDGNDLLAAGSEGVRDGKVFRVGNASVSAAVGGKTFWLKSVALGFSDDAVPTCTIGIPVGTPAGVRATEATSNDVTSIATAFTKFAAVTITLMVTAVDTTIESVGQAVQPGKYVLFSGVVGASPRVDSTGRSALDVEVVAYGKYFGLSSYLSVFGPFFPTGFMDPRVKIGSFILGVDPLVFQEMQTADVTAAIKSLCQRFLRVKTAVPPTALQKFAPVSSDLIAAQTALLNSIQGLATNRFSTPAMLQAISNLIVNVFTADARNVNLLSHFFSPSSFADSTDLRLILTADQAAVVPHWPFWPESAMRVLPAGTAFRQTHVPNAQGLPTAEVAGTVPVGSGSAAWMTSSKAIPVPINYDAAHVIDAAKRLPTGMSLVDVAAAPPWITVDAVTLPDIRRAGGGQPYDTSRPLSQASAVAASTATNAPSDKKVEASYTTFLRQWARFNTYNKLLRSHVMTVTTFLRGDVVPGMNIGVDTVTVSGGAETTVRTYGYVKAVKLTIATTATEAVASTEIAMTHVRSADMQRLVDTPDTNAPNEHYLWQDATAAINRLTLWTPV